MCQKGCIRYSHPWSDKMTSAVIEALGTFVEILYSILSYEVSCGFVQSVLIN